MINHYKASKGCASLNSFAGQHHSSNIYQELIADGTIRGQCKELLQLYSYYPEGLTDVQASKLLGWDCSTVSARRNDLARKVGSHVVITMGKRDNGFRRKSGIVWNINNEVKIWLKKENI